MSTIEIITITISITSLVVSLFLFLWNHWYKTPKIKKIIWVYNSLDTNNNQGDFLKHLKDFRLECDGFINKSIKTISDKNYKNKYFSLKFHIEKINIYALVIYEGNHILLLEKTNFGYRFLICHKNRIPRRTLRKIYDLYKQNEYAQKLKKDDHKISNIASF